MRDLRLALQQRADAAAAAATADGAAAQPRCGGVVPPIALKVGAYPDADSLRRVAQCAAAAGAAALSGAGVGPGVCPSPTNEGLR